MNNVRSRSTHSSRYSSIMKVFVVLAIALAAVVANNVPVYKNYPAPPAYTTEAYAKEPEYTEPPKPYNFGYAVKNEETYNNFDHQESSDGKTISGSYRVNLPDGRVQIVTYRAGENGNIVDVKYEGEARYPDPPAPTAAPKYPVTYTPAAYAPAPYAPAAYAPAPYSPPVYPQPAKKY